MKWEAFENEKLKSVKVKPTKSEAKAKLAPLKNHTLTAIK